MIHASPFRIRDGTDPLELAVRIIGKPVSVRYQSPDGMAVVRTLDWHMYDNNVEIMLTIQHMQGSNHMDFSLSKKRMSDDLTMFRACVPGSSEKIGKFLEGVRKPWEEWTEEEIMEEPMWIAMYKEQTGLSTETMHSRMVMESYKNPSDEWVRRYFKK